MQTNTDSFVQVRDPSHGSYQKRAYEYVKSQIMSLALKPGQHISEKKVAADLGCSRTPVREALRRLEQDGFLIDRARRGWQVYTLSLDDVNNIFALKYLIEGMISRRAAACSDQALHAALREAVANLRGSVKDYTAWRQASIEYHRVVYAMCPNPHAARIVDGLNDQWCRLRIGLATVQGRVEQSTSEHEGIAAAILAGDADEAERQTHVHVENARQDLTRFLSYALPFVQHGV